MGDIPRGRACAMKADPRTLPLGREEVKTANAQNERGIIKAPGTRLETFAGLQ